MAQNRDAPAYQEYAASMMARVEYRIMPLVARGLLYTIRLECWVNRSVPKDPVVLARVLGCELSEIEGALPYVMPFLAESGESLICPELEDYRTHLAGVRDRQSEGGKAGAAMTNQRRSGKSQPTRGLHDGLPDELPAGSKLSTDKSKPAKSKLEKPPSHGIGIPPATIGERQIAIAGGNS